jgi:hypothetical protein
MRMMLEDQVPVAEHADIVVETLPGTTPPTERDPKDRRGVLVWALDLVPGETREVKLGWRMRWPADKAVVMRPQR